MEVYAMADSECPECAGHIIPRPGIEAGEVISCPDCGAKLEVKSVSPFTLDKAPEVQEDWGE